jgi:hypothetical protein
VKEIVLEGQHRHFHFSYTIVGDEKATSANAHVKKIEFTDLRDNVRYVFDFELDEFSVFYNKSVLKKYAVKSGVDVFERLRGMGTPLLAEDIDSPDIELYEQLKAEEAALNEFVMVVTPEGIWISRSFGLLFPTWHKVFRSGLPKSIVSNEALSQIEFVEISDTTGIKSSLNVLQLMNTLVPIF